MPKLSDTRADTTFTVFWDAINKARAERGLPEALYANVRDRFEDAMTATKPEWDHKLRSLSKTV
jgi:hypothetical protein